LCRAEKSAARYPAPQDLKLLYRISGEWVKASAQAMLAGDPDGK